MGTVHDIASAPSRRRTARPATPTADDIAAALAAGERLLTTNELANRIGRSPRSIRRDVKAGMPSLPIGARDHRFIERHALTWYAARREDAGTHTQGDVA